jgi:protein TonB
MTLKLTIFSILFLFSLMRVTAQTDSISDAPIQEEVVYEEYVLDSEPRYIGPDKSINIYLLKNTQYPEKAREKGIEGKVIVEFTVNPDSTLSKVNAISPKKLGYGLEEEAIRVIQSTSGYWKPAEFRGHPIRMQMHVMVTFELD